MVSSRSIFFLILLGGSDFYVRIIIYNIYGLFTLIITVYDEYTNANRDYISNSEYPDYGYDDYASNWTQYNSIEDYHPEETDELTTSKPNIIIEELPSKSENSINTNIIHSNYQSKQTVDIIDDDPDIKVIRYESCTLAQQIS